MVARILAVVFFCVLAGGFSVSAAAAPEADGFTIEDIEVRGLQRISEGTMLNYLPLAVGDPVNAEQARAAIKALYDTGFFEDVTLKRDGGTLIVEVKERPSIAYLRIRGNKQIETEDLRKNLKSVGVAEGRILNQHTLAQMRQELYQVYYSRGRYGVKIDADVKDIKDNQVVIDLHIQEGRTALIEKINIVGNESFSDDTLLEQFELEENSFLTIFATSDNYAREKLQGDIESLRSFYEDRGYADYRLEGVQVAITPDRESVYITVKVNEGNVYRVSDTKLVGEFVVPEEELNKLVLVTPGDIYSRRTVTQTSDLIKFRLGQEGYANAEVRPVPQLDEENNEVKLVFFVEPGSRVYVRRIEFRGTDGTNDRTFRREMRQMEGAWLSNRAVDRSRVRLQRINFVQNVEIEERPVPGENSEVDLEVKVDERKYGEFRWGVGYGEGTGLSVQGSIVHGNFLGTGETVKIQAEDTQISTNYSVSHTDPYATINGVSRTIGASYSSQSRSIRGVSSLPRESSSFNLRYGFPLSEFSFYRLGGRLDRSRLTASVFTSSIYRDFVENNGEAFVPAGAEENPDLGLIGTEIDTAILENAFVYDSRNRAIFADRGSKSSIQLEATVPGSDIEYYGVDFQQRNYFPLGWDLTASTNLHVAFTDTLGDETTSVPPWARLYAGGPTSVRGYKRPYLGPKDETGSPVGGTFLTTLQNELILPNFGKEAGQSTNIRFSLFADIGTVFEDRDAYDSDELRYSTGVAATWVTPLGLFRLSYAFPLNDKPGDNTNQFQVDIGTAF